MATGAFSTVKVFSCTLARDREQFGERITEWLKQHPELTPVDTVVSQSSDQEFHCLTVTLFLAGEMVAAERAPIVAPKRVVPRPLR
jgi:folate-dependent tRNA-U54 methylase TrmFO/GidA